MSTYPFTRNDSPSLGIEIELGIVDTDTFALSSACDRLLAGLPTDSDFTYKPELMQCCIEINTGICHTVAEARADLLGKLKPLQRCADTEGLILFWGGTHPFSRWADQQVTPNERYQGLVNSLQEMARRLITFGLHVHVGVDSGDKAVMICDRIMQHLPVLLALSGSSPYWEERDTGLCSHRSKIMEGLPTAGLPPLMRNWSEYVWLVNHMVQTEFISTIRELWWDVRPHHNFGTVEVRMCDMPGSLDDVCTLAALIQCLVQQLSDEIDEGTYQFDCHPMMVRQNKWRAARYGLEARLINSYHYGVETIPEIAAGLRKRLAPVSQALDCADELQEIQRIAESPGWADRQRRILAETGRGAEVVRQLTRRSRI